MSNGTRTPRMLMVFLLSVLFLLPGSMIFVNSDEVLTTVGDLNNTSSDRDSPRPTRAPQFTPVLECTENTTKSAYPGDVVIFNCTVTNEGDMYDDYSVDCIPIQGWDIVFHPDKFPRIPPLSSPLNDSEKIKSLTVRIVVGDLSNANVGNYSFEVTLRSSLSVNTSKINFTVEVLPLHRVDITAPSQKTRLPGEEVIYEFQIWNTGNVNDTYEIWIESSDPDWSVKLVDDSMETLNLHIGKGVVAPVIVFIPFDADAGYVHVTTFAAKLKGESAAPVERSYVKTIIGNITRIEVDRDGLGNTMEGIPGDELSFTFEIINKGNGPDTIIGSPGTFVLSRSPVIPVNWVTDIDSSSINEGGLPKGLAADISFGVRIPPLTPAGTYDFVVDIYSDIPLTHQETVSFSVTVLTFHNAEMEFNVTSMDADIGDNISFFARLNNTGNLRDTYSLRIEGHDSHWIWIGRPKFTVDFGDSYQTFFNVRVPMSAPAGIYEFLYTLFSEGDENITFEQRFEVKVAETLDFSFSVLNETLDVVIGSEILVHLMIENNGNADLPISLDIFGEPWGILAYNNLFLGFGEVKELKLSFRPPHGIELTDYAFLIIGEIFKETGSRENITLKINLLEPGPTDEYFEVLFSGGAYELQIEGEIDNSTVVSSENPDGFTNLWPSIPDDVFQERYVVSDTSRLDITVRLDGENIFHDISNEKYSLVIIKARGEDRASIVFTDMCFEGNSEEHAFEIKWPQFNNPYSILFTRLFRDKGYQISIKDMVMDRIERNIYNIKFHNYEYDFTVIKVEADGNSLAVVLKDMPIEDSDRIEYEIDWSKVVTNEGNAVLLSYRDEGGSVLSTFTLSPVSTGKDLFEGEEDNSFLSMQNLRLIIGILISVILLGTGVVIKGKKRRNRNMLTRYSVMGVISMNENGINFDDLSERMGHIKNKMKLDDKIIKRNLKILITNDHVYTKSIAGIPHYYSKDIEDEIRFGMN